jgi:hypothetical protein
MDEVMIALDSSAEYEQISCAEAGCGGCEWKHHRATGVVTYTCSGEPITEQEYMAACERLGQIAGRING